MGDPVSRHSRDCCHKTTFDQVLLFCTMTRLFDELESYLEWRGWSHLRLDGNSGSASERGELVRRFNDPGACACSCVWQRACAGVIP